ncbi:tetratricopeptide repeat protein [Streptomyces mutabilis]|uniref:tetratricopeptide repeat protein n=1 Tax=Streptomyces mutabilis TaxID=67332 RepID=UPI0039879823
MADVCSADASGRDRLLLAARKLQELAPHQSPGDPPEAEGASSSESAGPFATELVAVQQRSLAVSDKLMRAMERAVELERERNQANQMVLVLLAMVEKLHRDIAALSRAQDRLTSHSSLSTELTQTRQQLSRSERQRETAEAELRRARSERQKADQLAEEAAEQVRVLSEELERLRGQRPHEEPESSDPSPTPVLQQPLEGDDDIDVALAKASQHLDEHADRLDQLAGELHQDNPPPSPSTSANAPDNPSDNPADASNRRSAPRRHRLPARHEHAYWAPRSPTTRTIQALEMVEQTKPDKVNHPSSFPVRHAHAYLLGMSGDVAAAVEMYEQLVHTQVMMLGATHPNTFTARHNLAYWKGCAGAPEEAAHALAQLLSEQTEALGFDHPDTLTTSNNLAYWQAQAGDSAAGTAALMDLVLTRSETLGIDHPDTLLARRHLAVWHGETGDAGAAAADLEPLLIDFRRVYGSADPETVTTWHLLAHWQGEADRPLAAVNTLQQLVSKQASIHGRALPAPLQGYKERIAYWLTQAPGDSSPSHPPSEPS